MLTVVTILSQWYSDGHVPDWFYRTWRQALRQNAKGVPVLIVDNGGPIKPPYDDVDVVPAVDMAPHGRGTPGHFQNCWRSMAYGFEVLAGRGEMCVIFIGQHLFPGVTFVSQCMAALQSADLLMNKGCFGPASYFTEYMAVNPVTCRGLWGKRLPKNAMLEVEIAKWVEGLRVAAFPGFHRPRDVVASEEWTIAFHEPSMEDFKRFAEKRGFYRP